MKPNAMAMYSTLNAGQKRVFDAAIEWWHSNKRYPFEISGPPGAGKTYLINCIIDALEIDRERVAPLAYTGAAAINMRNHGMFNAKTGHSWLYQPVEMVVRDENGRVVMDPVFNKPKVRIEYVERAVIPGIDLFVVDEAGSVPPSMRRTIEKFGIPVIAAGDLDQLPPIHDHPAYLNNPANVHILDEIMRQNMNSGIIYLSQRAKAGLPIHCGWYNDALVIYEDQLTDDMMLKSNIVICSRNTTRDEFTHYFREKLFGFNTPLPLFRERVVCRQNNWQIETDDGINLTNGLLGNVCNDPMNTYDRKTGMFKLDFKPDMSIGMFPQLDCSGKYFTASSEARKLLKQDRYCIGEKFEFGYAITTHMSQGSEYNNGIYFEEFLNPNINHKLNYVGVSRFKQFCIYVRKRY